MFEIELPRPKHYIGYSDKELKKIFTKSEFNMFERFMEDKRCALVNRELLTYREDVFDFIQKDLIKFKLK